MSYGLARHKAQIYLFIVLVFITIASGEYWKQWFVLPFSVFFLYIVDLMFFNEADYMYEPNYYNWKDANEVDY